MTAQASPVASSTSGERAEIDAWHVRHRPRSATHDTIGISSLGFRGVPHSGQCDGGDTIDSPRGTRHNTTLRNDPTTAPNTNAITTTNAVPMTSEATA